MKQLHILSAILLITLSAFAQSRQDASGPIVLKRSQKLIKATGWALNQQTGKWVENKNVIDQRKCKPYMVSGQNQNFVSLEFIEVSVADSIYYGLIWKKKDGDYKYENIREEWRDYRSMMFMLFRQSEFDSLKSVVSKQEGANIKIESNLTGKRKSLYSSLGGEKSDTEENLLS